MKIEITTNSRIMSHGKWSYIKVIVDTKKVGKNRRQEIADCIGKKMAGKDFRSAKVLEE